MDSGQCPHLEWLVFWSRVSHDDDGIDGDGEHVDTDEYDEYDVVVVVVAVDYDDDAYVLT